METDRRLLTVSKATAALLLISIGLASTTAYFAYRAEVASNHLGSSGGSSSLNYGSAAVIAPGNNFLQVANAASTPNAITVSGAGAVSFTPNEALIQVSIITNNNTAAVSTSSNAAETSKVIKALEGIGVSNSSIETQGYELNVDYSNCFNNQNCIPQIIAYRVANSLQVNITSSIPNQLGTQVGTVIDTAVGAGANQVSLTFSETNSALAALTTSGLQQALAAASSKAKVIASSLGVSITGVVSAIEGSSAPPQNYGNGAFVPQITSVVSTPILPGSQSFTVNVQVVYSIT